MYSCAKVLLVSTIDALDAQFSHLFVPLMTVFFCIYNNSFGCCSNLVKFYEICLVSSMICFSKSNITFLDFL